MSNLIKLCGVWARTDDQGNIKMSGRYTYDTKIIVLPNKYRQGDNDPTHLVFIAPNEKKQQQTTGAGNYQQPRPPVDPPGRAQSFPGMTKGGQYPPEGKGDDVPF